MTRKLVVVIASLVLAGGTLAAANQESLSAARDLYSSAAYEDALSLLNSLRSAGVNANEGVFVDQYRALCLLALGRTTEANDAIEAVVMADPLYRPPDGEVSPRIRSAFSDVRRRMLPGIAQQWYAQAKSAFDKKDYVAANDRFLQLIKVFADSDLGAADQTTIGDLRMLAVGFQELSAKAIQPPAPLQAVVTPSLPSDAPAVRPAPRIFSIDDEKVVPPVPIRQDLPPYITRVVMPLTGTIEVVIDETGAAESVIVHKSISPSYDRLVREAALKWRYTPATLDGAPVKFRKVVTISIAAPR